MIHLLLTAALAAEPQAAPPVTWALSDLFATVEDFETERTSVEAAITRLPECKGQLGSDAATLKGCLDDQYAAMKRLAWLYSYAGNHASGDARDDAWAARESSVMLAYAKYGEATAWVEPEIIALGAPKIDGFLAAEPGLKPYDYPLHRVLRKGEHVLTANEERILALSGPMQTGPSDTFTTFLYAELPWPSYKHPSGAESKLTPTEYSRLRGDPDAAVRKAVFDTYYGTLSSYEGTLGRLLSTQVSAHWYEAQARGYDSSVEAAIGNEFLPRAIYDTLVKESRANLPTLHRYFKLRQRILGLDKLTYADLYVPIVTYDREFSLEESGQLTIAATKPLGKEYQDLLAKGISARWMDPYPREGKRGGAYMDGSAYGLHPYILLNHQDDYESASTFAHEWGHGMHSVYSSRTQPYATSDYATFIAEVASTMNEALLLDLMLKNAKTDDERLFYLGSSLEQLRTTFFRQAMFAEFELAIHTEAEQGKPLTGARFTEIYGGLVRAYHGHDQGIVTVEDAWTREWAYIPHFYYNFYVYQYATSLAASSLLSEQILSGDKAATERYLTLLSAGGSDDPHLLLTRAGVDLSKPEPYRAVAARMDKIMDEMEQILDKKAGKKGK